MPITDKMIDQACSDLKATCGGVRNDYFGLVYLENEHGIAREKAVNQVAFGGNDYGLDGFHFDRDKRNLYLFQFKNSDSHAQFKQSMQRMIEAGMEQVFIAQNRDCHKNQVLVQLWACMDDNRALIDQVCIHFVFKGDPAEAQRSQALDKLREDLEHRKYLIDKFFGDRQVDFVVEFRSVAGKVGAHRKQREAKVYALPMTTMLTTSGPNGECLHVGFMRLLDLHGMHRDMGQQFFERNIRYGLGSSGAVNRAISRSLKQIVLDEKESPEVFAFSHNGIALAAEHIEHIDGVYRITAPRLLNGAQTVTTFGEFLQANADNPKLAERRDVLERIRVLCKVVAGANPEFVTNVTINNNRQNPVEPWNLHANDLIQLELQDKFRDDLGIFYERQENAFESLTGEDRADDDITEILPIQLVKLAQTFLVTDGNLDKLSRMREVFEDERVYGQVFATSRLTADSRQIVLCYKVQFRLRKLLKEIADKGPNKYWYINRARSLLWALLCQGVLNDGDLEDMAERFGREMSIKADFTAHLVWLATARCRVLLAELVKDPAYAEKVVEENFSFLRTNTAYKRCMDIAYKKWKWVEKRLR